MDLQFVTCFFNANTCEKQFLCCLNIFFLMSPLVPQNWFTIASVYTMGSLWGPLLQLYFAENRNTVPMGRRHSYHFYIIDMWWKCCSLPIFCTRKGRSMLVGGVPILDCGDSVKLPHAAWHAAVSKISHHQAFIRIVQRDRWLVFCLEPAWAKVKHHDHNRGKCEPKVHKIWKRILPASCHDGSLATASHPWWSAKCFFSGNDVHMCQRAYCQNPPWPLTTKIDWLKLWHSTEIGVWQFVPSTSNPHHQALHWWNEATGETQFPS